MTQADTGKTVIIRVQRQDGPNKPTRWEEFAVPYRPNMNIISCLQYIAANPVTTDGKASNPVVFDSGCLEEVCGACTVLVDDVPTRSCLMFAIQADGKRIRTQDLPNLRKPDQAIRAYQGWPGYRMTGGFMLTFQGQYSRFSNYAPDSYAEGVLR